jgi:hypothetical protein
MCRWRGARRSSRPTWNGDFERARKQHHDLARRRVMPALIKTRRQLDEADTRRGPRAGLQNRVAELIGPPFIDRNFDLWSAKIQRQSSSTVQEAVLVVKFVQYGMRHHST